MKVDDIVAVGHRVEDGLLVRRRHGQHGKRFIRMGCKNDVIEGVGFAVGKR